MLLQVYLYERIKSSTLVLDLIILPLRLSSSPKSILTIGLELSILHGWVQVSYADFQEFASLRKELHKLQVALEFYQKTTGQFTLGDLKVGRPVHCCSLTLSPPIAPPPPAAGPQQAPVMIAYWHSCCHSALFAVQQYLCLLPAYLSCMSCFVFAVFNCLSSVLSICALTPITQA